MKIVIDIRSMVKKKTGIGYYTLNLVNNLAAVDQKNDYTLYSKIGYFSRKKKLIDLPGANFHHCINRFGLNPALLLKGQDILYTCSYDIEKPKNAKFVVVVHDVIHKTYPEGHSKETIKLVEESLAKILPQIDWIITPTNNTKEDFLKFYEFPKDRISAIYSGINEEFFKTADRDSLNMKEPFILFVGTLEPRKNITGLIRAFNMLKKNKNIPHKLVVVGMRGWMYEDIFQTARELNLSEDIIFTDYLAQEKTQSLLQNAEVFVYPSFYEGFGFPVLEAFASKTAVVTSNNSSLKEIAADCALLINPNNPEDIAEAIFKIISDTHLKQGLIEKGFNRAKEFSWKRTVGETLDVFKKVV